MATRGLEGADEEKYAGTMAISPAMPLFAHESHALAAFQSWIRERFSDRLCELKLFGSRARGTGHEQSDLDFQL